MKAYANPLLSQPLHLQLLPALLLHLVADRKAADLNVISVLILPDTK